MDKEGETICAEDVRVAHLDRMISIVEDESHLRIWTPVGNEPMIEIKYAKTIKGTKG
jgi:hypothetical protein